MNGVRKPILRITLLHFCAAKHYVYVMVEPLFDGTHIFFGMLFATLPCIDAVNPVAGIHHVLNNPDGAAAFE
jgi:hypothetical protein